MKGTSRQFAGSDTYISGNAWFVCDRCGFTYRRSQMLTEWTGLKVDAACRDFRPPQMQPPNVYPEGIPFPDARPPQDHPDPLMDDSFLQSTTGGIEATTGLYPTNNAQASPPGAISPQQVIVDPIPSDTPLRDIVADDVTLRTGPIPAPTSDPDDFSIPPGAANPPFDT